jgi:hypothetical protein
VSRSSTARIAAAVAGAVAFVAGAARGVRKLDLPANPQIRGSATGEFVYATPSLERDRLSRLTEVATQNSQR